MDTGQRTKHSRLRQKCKTCNLKTTLNNNVHKMSEIPGSYRIGDLSSNGVKKAKKCEIPRHDKTFFQWIISWWVTTMHCTCQEQSGWVFIRSLFRLSMLTMEVEWTCSDKMLNKTSKNMNDSDWLIKKFNDLRLKTSFVLISGRL